MSSYSTTPFWFSITRFSTFGTGLVMAVAVGLGSNAAFATGPNLGSAADFAILGLGGTASSHGSVIINSSTSINGNVGYGAYTQSGTNQKVDVFNGSALVHSTASFSYTTATFSPTSGVWIGTGLPGDPVNITLMDATASATAAGAAFSSLTPTLTLGAVNGNTVVNSTGDLNIISISSLSFNSNTLTLHSRPGFTDTFVFNISGNFAFAQSTVLLQGTDAGHVLYNFTGTNSNILINKATTVFNGTVLAPLIGQSVIYHNPATFNGAIIAYNIDVHSDFNLNHVGYVPSPGSASLLGLAGVAAARRRRRAT